MRIRFEGELPPGVAAKDLILGAIGRMGVGRLRHVVEYAGPIIRGLSMENRLTICNMSIEFGARAGMICPDDTTFAYSRAGPPHRAAPTGSGSSTSGAASQPTRNARFDRELTIDASELSPQVTWARTRGWSRPVHGGVPDPSDYADPSSARRSRRALAYMDLVPGTRSRTSRSTASSSASCTNARIEDLRAAARSRRRRRVHPSVRALVVPGSATVKRQAEEEGLDACSPRPASSGVAPAARCASA